MMRMRAWFEAGNTNSATDRSQELDAASSVSGREFAIYVNRIAENADAATGERALERMAALLGDLDSTIEEAEQILTEYRRRKYSGRTKNVTVTISQWRRLQSVEYDIPWLRKATDSAIVQETALALKHASAASSESRVETAMEGTSLGKLRDIAMDPLRYASELGMR